MLWDPYPQSQPGFSFPCVPAIRGPPFGKSPMLSQATARAKLSLNSYTWHFLPSLPSRSWLRSWACWDLFSSREQKAELSPVTERTRVFVEKGHVVQNLQVFQLCLHRVEINVGSGWQASSALKWMIHLVSDTCRWDIPGDAGDLKNQSHPKPSTARIEASMFRF